MAIKALEPRDMLTILDKTLPPKMGFVESVVRGRHNTHATKVVDIKVRKRKRLIAPNVKRTSTGVKIDVPLTRLDTLEPPYIKMTYDIEPESLNRVAPNDVVYSKGHNPESNRIRLVAEGLDIMRNAGMRRIMLQVSQAIATGKVEVRGKDDNNEEVRFDINFERDADLTGTLTGGDLWTAENSNPEKTIRTIARIIGEKSGVPPTSLYLGADALDAFLSNPHVLKVLDIRGIKAGSLNSNQIAGDGRTLYGNFGGVAVFGFDDWYWDENTSSLLPIIPTDKALFFSDQAEYSIEYGMISDVEAGNFAVKWFPKNWISPNPSVMHVMLQGAPVFLPKDVDSTAGWKVV